MGRFGLRAVALVYLLFLLVLPVGLICWRTFQNGFGPVVDALTAEPAVHALQLTFSNEQHARRRHAYDFIGLAVE